MIPNHWYPIYPAKNLRKKKPVGVKRLGQHIVLWRDEYGTPTGFIDRCCHRAAQLSLGRVHDGCLECPYHGMRFDGQGQCRDIPSMGDKKVPQRFKLTPLDICERHGFIWLYWGDKTTATEPQWFDPGEYKTRTYAVWDNFPVHYDRIMENMTDAHHVAFVHRTLGLGAFKHIENVTTEVSGTHIKFQCEVVSASNPNRKLPFAAEIHMPCAIKVAFSDKVFAEGCATPIDDANTWFYVNYHQGYVTLPIVGDIVTWLVMFSDWVLAQKKQDLPIWQSQTVNQAHAEDYLYFHADQGVSAYYKLKESLVDNA